MNRYKMYESIAESQKWHTIFKGDAQTALGIGPFQLLYENASAEVEGISKTSSSTRELLFDIYSRSQANTTVYYYMNLEINWPVFLLKPRYNFDHFVYKFFNWFRDHKNNLYTDFYSNYKLISPMRNMGYHFLSQELLLFFNFEHGWTVEGNGHQLLIYKDTVFIEESHLISFIEVCQTILKMFAAEKVL